MAHSAVKTKKENDGDEYQITRPDSINIYIYRKKKHRREEYIKGNLPLSSQREKKSGHQISK